MSEDDGIYGAVSDVPFGRQDIELAAGTDSETVSRAAAGLSCDALDIMLREKMTVSHEIGDVLPTPVCGAYTSSSVTLFNGFVRAGYVLWEDIRATIE